MREQDGHPSEIVPAEQAVVVLWPKSGYALVVETEPG